MEENDIGPRCCVCAIRNDEGQSLRESESAMFTLDSISNYEINNDLKFIQSTNQDEPKTRITPWNQSCDPVPIRNAVEVLIKLLSKAIADDGFYFIFSEVEGKHDKNNSRNDSCSISDTLRSVEHMSSTRVEESGSVFGSPLKLEPIADISMNETTSDCLSTTSVSDQYTSRLIGLSIFEARRVLSRFCQMECKDSPVKSVVILCDSDEIKSAKNDFTILLGVHRDVNEKSKKLTTFKVVSSNKRHSLTFLEPLNLARGSVCPMVCWYDLLEQRDRKRKLKIEAVWSNCHGNSIISNLHAARFNLHVTSPFGFKEGPLYHQLGQLKHIMMLCKGLKDGELPSILSTSRFGSPVENLQNLFKRIESGIQDSKSSVREVGKAKKINLASSYSADITDDLWEIFVQCESYQEMVMCLKMAFNTFKKKEFPLFVRNDNETLLARLVMQSNSGLTYFPPLTNLMPLRIVAELGLEQMKKIYTTILLQNELCSHDDIENFMKDSLREETSDNNLSMSVSEPDHQLKESLIETVKKLHHCVEILCLVDLHSDNLPLKAVASHILNQLKSNSLDDNLCFVVPLDSRSASQEVEKMSPCLVRREFTVGEQHRVECLVSELPEELAAQSRQQPIASDTSTSISINESVRDCYKFTTEENVMNLGASH